MASVKARKKGRARTQRYTSNIFSMFTEAQINEFKEAFSMIDVSKDGTIDKEDLIQMLTSLGKEPTEEYLEDMLSQSQSLNFTMFLTMFGEKMMGSDPEATIYNAFKCFDPDDTGFIQEDRLRELMTTMGDRWTHGSVDELFHGAPIKDGSFNYKEFIKMLMHGQDDEEPTVA